MTVTIQGITNPGGCDHRTVQTDKGTFALHLSEIRDEKPDTLAEMHDTAVAILKHQYLTERAAGKTHAEALQVLAGFVVRW